jgi:hypothetical protein
MVTTTIQTNNMDGRITKETRENGKVTRQVLVNGKLVEETILDERKVKQGEEQSQVKDDVGTKEVKDAAVKEKKDEKPVGKRVEGVDEADEKNVEGSDDVHAKEEWRDEL